jgi:mono/diheme cytochrome c family protein
MIKSAGAPGGPKRLHSLVISAVMPAMKKTFKILGIVLMALILIVAVSVLLFLRSFPRVGPPPDLAIRATPELIARGAELAERANCIDCHSERDWTRYAGPVIPGTEGKGGEPFTGTFGKLYAPNITPAGVGDWTDGELFRAITAGVTKDGEALFPLMPYNNFGRLPVEDVHAIIAFLRTLPPIENAVPERELIAPLEVVVKMMPNEGTPMPRAEPGTVAYGEYLVTLGSCADCHTQQGRQGPVAGMAFAGGFKVEMPDGTHRLSANITPDEETGIGFWDRESFVDRFKDFADGGAMPLAPGMTNTPMPWSIYAKWSREDLGAVYDYLSTLPPVANEVVE